MRRTVVLVSLLVLLTSSMPAIAQSTYDMQTPPKVLNIVREFIKVGKDYAHDQHEAAWLQAMLKANFNTYSLTLTAVTGEPEEWFMTGYNSFAAWEKDNRRLENDPSLAKVMAEYAAKDGDYINSGRRIVAVFRPDLSYKPDFKLGEYKYFNIVTVRYRPGSRPEDSINILKQALEKAEPTAHMETYEVESGAPAGTFFYLLPLKSVEEWDHPNPAFAQAMKEGHWEDAIGKTVMNAEFRLFSFNPRLSHVPDAVASLDPAFWNPKPVVSRSETAKKPTPAAKKEAPPEKKP